MKEGGKNAQDFRHIQSSPHLSCTDGFLGGEELGGEEHTKTRCVIDEPPCSLESLISRNKGEQHHSVNRAHHSSASAHPKSF